MKVHKHIGVISAIDEITLKEALALAALQHEVLVWLAPNVAVMEREHAEAVAAALKNADLHPKVFE